MNMQIDMASRCPSHNKSWSIKRCLFIVRWRFSCLGGAWFLMNVARRVLSTGEVLGESVSQSVSQSDSQSVSALSSLGISHTWNGGPSDHCLEKWDAQTQAFYCWMNYPPDPGRDRIWSSCRNICSAVWVHQHHEQNIFARSTWWWWWWWWCRFNKMPLLTGAIRRHNTSIKCN